VSPHEVVAAGLRAMLARADGAVHVVPEQQDDANPPDVVLYDVLALHLGDCLDLDRSVASTTVIALGRDLRPDLQARALERGAAAAVSLGITGEQLIEVVLSAVEGTLAESPVVRQRGAELPLGREAGLSARESSVLRLIVQDYTNLEIAEMLNLSINSIKTYIRTTYRKIGVRTRQQAVTWAIQHGFPIERDDQPEVVAHPIRTET
jgi:DNA-binding NarL/FixJ family response regulator